MNAIRQSWLDNLGLEMPTTPEEQLEVAKAFTFQDPDGNGKDDTWGMSGMKGLGRMNFCFNPFGIIYGYDDWTVVDGKVTPMIVQDGMKDALAYIKECYDAGVIDPDSFVQDGTKQWEKVRQGTYGIFEMYANGVLNVAMPAMKALDETVNLKLIYPPVKGPDGTQIMRTADRANSGLFAAPVTNEHPEAFAQIFQWLLEGNADTVNFGNQEGVSYHQIGQFQWEVGRQSDPTWYRMNYRLMYSISSHAASDQGVYDFWQTMYEHGITTPDYPLFIKAEIEYGVANDYFIKSKIAIDKMPELQTYFDELAMDIVLGKKPIDAFDGWVEFFYANGGEEIIEDATKLNM
jgi:putative aldouronate transport system substrate-binding protein